MISKVLWLVYKRLRVGFGFMGFVIMYGAYTGNLNWVLLPMALGVFSIEIFGAAYNDYTDFEEDVRNERHDKWTVSGLLSREQVKYFSFFMLSLGLFFMFLSGILLPGIYYAFMMWAYSYEKIRLKKYNILAYILGGASWLIIPISMNMVFFRSISLTDIFFTLFCFFQYVYLLSQKDSTDMMDETNLFLAKGWKKSLYICTVLSILSSAFLLTLSMSSATLLFIWAANSITKIFHFRSVLRREINRTLRNRLVLIEFLTPYLYSGGVIFA